MPREGNAIHRHGEVRPCAKNSQDIRTPVSDIGLGRRHNIQRQIRTTPSRICAHLGVAIIGLLLAGNVSAQDLIWDSVQGATSYRVRYARDRVPTKSDSYTSVVAPTITVPSMQDGDYRIAVVAVNQNGESEFSNVLPITCANTVCRVPVPVPPVVSVKKIYRVAAITGQTTRPLYTDGLRATKLGSITFDRDCENYGPPISTTTAGEWRWATNNSMQRGVTLCREIK